MSYLFTCDHCQTKTLVDDQYSGQTGRCVTCGHDIRLPNFAPAEPSAGRPINQTAAGGKPVWDSRRSQPLARRLVAAAIVLVVVACAAVAMVRYGGPTLSTIQTNRMRLQSQRNIERIASALNAYAADHGTYPPPAIGRPDGTLMHSWRVLILPYLGEKQLFNAYDFDQPWDAPANLELTHRMPAVYRSSASPLYSGDAAYYLITGPGTLFPPAPSPASPATRQPSTFLPLSPAAVADDPGQTLLVVEANSMTSGYYPSWLEPRDLDVTRMQGLIGSSPGYEIGGLSGGGAVVATVDGRSHFLSDQVSPAIVMALISIAGGEPLADDVLDR